MSVNYNFNIIEAEPFFFKNQGCFRYGVNFVVAHPTHRDPYSISYTKHFNYINFVLRLKISMIVCKAQYDLNLRELSIINQMPVSSNG